MKPPHRVACTQGIEEGSKLPPPMNDDPALLPEEERARLGIAALPATLDEAHDSLERDTGLLRKLLSGLSDLGKAGDCAGQCVVPSSLC